MAVDLLDMPSKRLETLRCILALRRISHGVQGDVIGIVNQHEVIELVVAGERRSLGRDALLQAAVPREADNVVVEDRVGSGVEAGRSHFLRYRNADSVGHPLPQRSGGALDPLGFKILRMPRGVGAEHPEVFHLIDAHLRVTG